MRALAVLFALLAIVAVLVARGDCAPPDTCGTFLNMAQDLVAAAGVECQCPIAAVRPFPPSLMVDRVRRTVKRGRLDRGTGTMYIAMQRHDGTPLPPAVVNGILVHEVAHACMGTGAHSDEWRRMFVRLLDVATRVLRWPVMLECSSCPMYKLCDKSAACPLCAWKECPKK